MAELELRGAKNENRKKFFDTVERFARERRKFLEIKNDPERKATHTGYGLESCLGAVIAAAISVLCFLGLSALTGGGETAWLLLILIPLIVTMFLLPPIMLISGIVAAIRQLCLDKKLGGVLGILLNLAMLALYIALIFNSNWFT